MAIAAAATLTALLLAAATGAAIPAIPDHQAGTPRTGAPHAVPATTTPTPTPHIPGTRTVPLTPTATAPPPSTSSPPPPDPGTLTVDADAEVNCPLGGLLGYTLEVTAAANQRLDTAQLFVADGDETRTYNMDVDGSGAAAETEPRTDPELEWWVEVTGGDAQTAETSPAQVSPCG